MNTRSLECFIRAAECMNFSKAAEQLYVSQQTLSEHIRRLEATYSISLFERTPHLKLTAAGEVLLEHARILLQDEANLTARMSDLSKTYQNVISIGCPYLRSEFFIPYIYEKYHPDHPNIVFRIKEKKVVNLKESLRKREIDTYFGVNIAADPLYERILIAEEKPYLMIHKKLLLREYPSAWEAILVLFQHEGITLDSFRYLSEIPMVHTGESTSIRDIIDGILHKEKIIPHISFETESLVLAYQMMKKGIGYCVLPQFYCYQRIDDIMNDPGIYIFPVETEGSAINVYLITEKVITRPSYLEDFLAVSKEVYREFSESQRLKELNRLIKRY